MTGGAGGDGRGGTPGVAGTGLLLGDVAGGILRTAVTAAGQRLRSWEVRKVYLRGSSTSVIYDARLEEEPDEVVLVGHVSSRSVPAGATQVSAGDVTVHVWRYPSDPYCPGLPSAVSRRRVRELLDRIGVADGQVRLRGRSYRPTRRAVVEVTVDRPGRGAEARVLYLKVLGGRTPDRVRRRARELARPHRVLAEAGLPVPAVVGVAAAQGIVALSALRGRTLRAVLLDGEAPLPAASTITGLTERLAEVALDGGADPRGFASAQRHVERLVVLAPELEDTVREVAAEADAAGGPAGTVHGDLHDGQLLFEGRSLTGVLDVDGAGAGLLAHDAGRLLAYVESAGEHGPVASARAETLLEDLVESYRQLIPPRELFRAAAGAALSMATAPGRAPDEQTRARARAHIGRAAAWIDR